MRPDEHALDERAEHGERREKQCRPRRSKPKRAAANSANVVWKIANANQ